MQLRACLLIAFVNVACLNIEKDSSSLRDIFSDVAPMRMNKSVESVKKDPSSFVELLADVAPMRMNQSVELLKKDPSSFVELFASANPDVINQVIGLLETLVSEADSSLITLTDRVTETSNNAATANNELVAAQDALTAANTAKSDAENAETAAKEKHDTAKAEKDAAQNDYDDQSPTYLEEKRVLQEVIEKLRPLSDYTTNCVKITTGSNSYNDGEISVKMQVNSGAITELLHQQWFKLTSVVFERCLGDQFRNLVIQNSDSNCWSGTMEFKKDKIDEYRSMICSDCSEGTGPTNMFAVDGNSDGDYLGKVFCGDGKQCNVFPGYSTEQGLCRQNAVYGGYCRCPSVLSPEDCYAKSIGWSFVAVQYRFSNKLCALLQLLHTPPTECPQNCLAYAGNGGDVTKYNGDGDLDNICMLPQ